jgi:cell division protein FtsB
MTMGKLMTFWAMLKRHKYWTTIAIFLLWMSFLDENNWILRFQHKSEIATLNSEIERYRKQFNDDTERLEELTANPEALEKVAREKYFMKRPDEDVFIFDK